MLLLAAGRGRRFGGAVPKVFLDLAGKPVLLHSAERLIQTSRLLGVDWTSELVVVVSPHDRQQLLAPLLPALTALGAQIIDGGSSRQESMRRGLAAASPDCELVVVHDAARPLFDPKAAHRCIECARSTGAAILASPVADTIKRATQDGLVQTTVDRSALWAAQTPQVVQRPLLHRALDHADLHALAVTDESSFVEAVGGKVALVESSQSNLKITRRSDLAIAKALLQAADDSPENAT